MIAPYETKGRKSGREVKGKKEERESQHTHKEIHASLCTFYIHTHTQPNHTQTPHSEGVCLLVGLGLCECSGLFQCINETRGSQ